MIEKRACTFGKSDKEQPGENGLRTQPCIMLVLLLWKTTQDSPFKKPRIRERNTRNENFETCWFLYCLLRKKIHKLWSSSIANPNLTCVVSLYAKKFWSDYILLTTRHYSTGTLSGPFRYFFYVCLQVPGIFVYGRGWLGIFLTKKKKSCACTDLNNFIIFFYFVKTTVEGVDLERNNPATNRS